LATPRPTLIPVVAAVIRREGRYLIGRRPQEKRHGGLWEFPGGKVHPGEDDVAAARRELQEELGLEAVSVGALIWESADAGSTFVIRFVEVSTEGSPEAREHSEIGWFTPEEMSALPLAPTDAAFVRSLRSERRPCV